MGDFFFLQRSKESSARYITNYKQRELLPADPLDPVLPAPFWDLLACRDGHIANLECHCFTRRQLSSKPYL